MSTPPRKLRRRMSIDDVNADLLGHVHQTIERLGALWDKVSMDQQTRVKRTETAYALFHSTMNEIVAGEEEMVKGVHEDIKTDLADVTATRKELGIDPFPVDKFKPNSIALLKALAKDKISLIERKAQAMVRQLEEYNGLVKVCHCLGEPVPEYESIEERIMTKAKIDELSKRRLHLCKELQTRRATAEDLQNKANRRTTAISSVAVGEDEEELLTMDLKNPALVFSHELIQRFSNLVDKFEAEYEKWRENIVFQYLEYYTELASLSEKCYANSLISKFPETIDLDVHEESLLNEIRQELEMIRKRYESGKNIFDKFGQWHKCFKKQEEIEALLNTDNVRKNRGGCLAEILRDQKKNNALCIRFLKELQSACEESTTITIEGFIPYDFAQHLIQDREQQKENEKEMKKAAKAKQFQLEVTFGASGSPMKAGIKSSTAKNFQSTPTRTPMSASTPSRKRALNTPGRLTPVKY